MEKLKKFKVVFRDMRNKVVRGTFDENQLDPILLHVTLDSGKKMYISKNFIVYMLEVGE